MNPEVPEGLHWADAEIAKKVAIMDRIGRQYLKSIRNHLKTIDVDSMQMEAVQRKFDVYLREIDSKSMQKLTGLSFTRSSQVTARLAGTSSATVERVRFILKKASALTRKKLEDGQMTIQEAYRESGRDDEDQQRIDIPPRPFDKGLPTEERLLDSVLALFSPFERMPFRHLRATDIFELRGMVKFITMLERAEWLSARKAKVARRAAEQFAGRKGWGPI